MIVSSPKQLKDWINNMAKKNNLVCSMESVVKGNSKVPETMCIYFFSRL